MHSVRLAWFKIFDSKWNVRWTIDYGKPIVNLENSPDDECHFILICLYWNIEGWLQQNDTYSSVTNVYININAVPERRNYSV